MKKVNFENYHSTLDIKASKMMQICWYLVNIFFFKNAFIVGSKFKVLVLKLFGAKVGKGVVIKPSVNIKYPWKLKIGDYSWIGENVWIDNLAEVTIGNHVCISQGVLLLTGNHNFKTEHFELMVNPIEIEDGVWLGAKSVICPGVVCFTHSVLTVGSVATSNLEAYSIYQGNPSKKIKDRIIH